MEELLLQARKRQGLLAGESLQASQGGVAVSVGLGGSKAFTFHFHALEKEMATHPVYLLGESQGWGSLVGCRLWGRTESDTTETT